MRHQPGGGGGFGWPHRHLRVTDSTNARARELAEGGAPGGTVVTADEQTAGRGRQGRTWTAPPGGALLYSAILRPLDERHLLLPLAVPLAVCEAAEELLAGLSSGDAVEGEAAFECQIKWPNDIWLEGRKLAGVLIEAKPQDGWAVLGVGLNLAIESHEFPPELRDTAISLTTAASVTSRAVPLPDHAGPRDSATSLAAAAWGAASPPGAVPPRASTSAERARRVLDRCLDRWVAEAEDAILAAWRSRDALRGRQVAWDGGSGVADGVDDRGRLAVIVPAGERVLLGAGDVHLRL